MRFRLVFVQFVFVCVCTPVRVFVCVCVSLSVFLSVCFFEARGQPRGSALHSIHLFYETGSLPCLELTDRASIVESVSTFLELRLQVQTAFIRGG